MGRRLGWFGLKLAMSDAGPRSFCMIVSYSYRVTRRLQVFLPTYVYLLSLPRQILPL